MELLDYPVALGRVHCCSDIVYPVLGSKDAKTLLVHWGPLFEMRTPGNPFLLKISVKCLTTICAVIILYATASGHLVATSIQVKIYSTPPLALGNGPTRSTLTRSCRNVTTSLSHIGVFLGLDLINLWQVSHSLSWALASLQRDGQ